MIAGTATEEAGFLWLGVPLNGHGRLHLTPVNVAKIRDYNHSFRVGSTLEHHGAQVSLDVGWHLTP